jgi:pimeloyl-ACP methyl ester carboxylesterase
LLAIVVAAFLVWVLPPLGPGERASAALESGDGVTVTHTDDGWVFLPESESGVPSTGLVFYPGGRVDARSYAPFARALAAEGHAVVIVEVPLSLAVLEVGAADDVIASPQLAAVTRWAVGGHSLGGAMAAQYLADTRHPEVEGLLLLAAYPPSGADLSGSGASVTDVTASLDSVLDRENWVAGRALLPENAYRVSISGGNHAGFGDYGPQPGDAVATCTPEEQLLQMVRAADELLERM